VFVTEKIWISDLGISGRLARCAGQQSELDPGLLAHGFGSQKDRKQSEKT
jgi:hypothetical protein